MKVIVTGSRNYTDYGTIFDALKVLPTGTTIIHGACDGADKLADRAAEAIGHQRIPVPAEWRKFGSSAGPIRNAKMLADHKPDLVIAFPQKRSKGTWDMIRKAFDAGVPVKIVPEVKRG